VKDTLYLAVPADATGAEIFGPWDPVGMRGTVSRSLRFTDVFVGDDDMIMPRGLYYQAALRWPHMFMMLCPTYLGVAQAAVDFTVSYLRGEAPGAPRPGLRRSATKQLAVGEMRIKLEQAKALFHQAIAEARLDPPRDCRLRAYAAQYTVMEHANDICRLAIRTCGGRSIMKSLPLERLYRDSRCGSLMLPWTAEICVERLGRESLYEPGERE
jgi:alkylation response protein AidB-like acyl-CoA dehydrogenase